MAKLLLAISHSVPVESCIHNSANLSYLNRHLACLCLILAAAIYTSCHNEPNYIKDYYLPDLSSGPVVMVYQDSALGGQYEFWVHQLDDLGLIQSCQCFGQSLWTQRAIFEAGVNGFHMRYLEVLYPDSNAYDYKIAEVLQDDVFPFQRLEEKQTIINHLKIYESNDSSRYSEITKNRFDDGAFAQKLGSKNVWTVKFRTSELFEHFENGFVDSKSRITEEYAQGIGLVRYTKRNESGLIADLIWRESLSPTEFIKKYNLPVPCVD